LYKDTCLSTLLLNRFNDIVHQNINRSDSSLLINIDDTLHAHVSLTEATILISEITYLEIRTWPGVKPVFPDVWKILASHVAPVVLIRVLTSTCRLRKYNRRTVPGREVHEIIVHNIVIIIIKIKRSNRIHDWNVDDSANIGCIKHTYKYFKPLYGRHFVTHSPS
jgi:hypothetical protein